MKKSVGAPENPVHEKSSRKSSLNDRGKNKPFQKPDVSIRPNDQGSLDDEFPISGRKDSDREAGMNTPSHEPW